VSEVAPPARDAHGAGAVGADREYTEALLSLRHYSSLRFAIFSVFIAITAALVSVLFGKDAIDAPRVRTALQALGLWTAFVFLWIEITLDGYVTAFGEKALAICPDSHLAGRPVARRMLIPFATASLHVAVILFWIAALAT
jgi:hypothetical protein